MRAAVVFLLAVGGCSPAVTYAPLNPSPRALAPRPAETVEVFMTGPPERPFVGVGEIDVAQPFGTVGHEIHELVDRMRERAGEQGCDALVVTGVDHRYRGTCIVFTPGSTGG